MLPSTAEFLVDPKRLLPFLPTEPNILPPPRSASDSSPRVIGCENVLDSASRAPGRRGGGGTSGGFEAFEPDRKREALTFFSNRPHLRFSLFSPVAAALSPPLKAGDGPSGGDIGGDMGGETAGDMSGLAVTLAWTLPDA